MKIVMGNDKGAYWLKKAIKEKLEKDGHEIIDCGTKSPDEAKAHTIASKDAAEVLQAKQADLGILLCGTGMGVCMAANKFKGIYAAAVESVYSAERCRMINDCNVLCLGANILGEVMALEMVDKFINTEFAQGFEPERKAFLHTFIEQNEAFENENFK